MWNQHDTFACLPRTPARRHHNIIEGLCVIYRGPRSAISRHCRLDGTRLVRFRCAHRVPCTRGKPSRQHFNETITRILAETGRAVIPSMHARSGAPAPPVHLRMAVPADTLIFRRSYTSPRQPAVPISTTRVERQRCIVFGCVTTKRRRYYDDN